MEKKLHKTKAKDDVTVIVHRGAQEEIISIEVADEAPTHEKDEREKPSAARSSSACVPKMRYVSRGVTYNCTLSSHYHSGSNSHCVYRCTKA
ncbi:MAG TPA: hypothetical protein VIN10_07700 [Bacteroidales bacterium]